MTLSRAMGGIPRCLFLAVFFFAIAARVDSSEVAVWVGKGIDGKWTTPENWSGGKIPGPDIGVLLDGSSSADSILDPLSGKGREAVGFVVSSITVTPEYKGLFSIAAPATVKGKVVLSGRVQVQFDPHINFMIMGSELNLSGLVSMNTRFAAGNFTFGAATEPQVVIPPKDKTIVIPELKKLDGGTLRLGGFLNTYGLMVDGKSEFDLNNHDIETRLLQIAGQVKNLGGRTISVTCAVGYTYNAFGFIRGAAPAAKAIDLAPEKPWKFIRKREKLLVMYGPREEWEFRFENCRVGNCDASGGEPLVGLKGSVDAGGNKNILFSP